MEDFTKALENLQKKKDYYYNIEFYGISSEYATAIKIIEALKKEIENNSAEITRLKSEIAELKSDTHKENVDDK